MKQFEEEIKEYPNGSSENYRRQHSEEYRSVVENNIVKLDMEDPQQSWSILREIDNEINMMNKAQNIINKAMSMEATDSILQAKLRPDWRILRELDKMTSTETKETRVQANSKMSQETPQPSNTSTISTCCLL